MARYVAEAATRAVDVAIEVGVLSYETARPEQSRLYEWADGRQHVAEYWREKRPVLFDSS
jgi:hypothetical protein